MPPVTTEQQALNDAATAIVQSFASLAALEKNIAAADGEYNAAAQARNVAQTALNEANKAFVANPADAKALSDYEAATAALLDATRKAQQLRIAKQQADASDDALLANHAVKLSNLKAAFEAFVAANTIELKA